MPLDLTIPIRDADNAFAITCQSFMIGTTLDGYIQLTLCDEFTSSPNFHVAQADDTQPAAITVPTTERYRLVHGRVRLTVEGARTLHGLLAAVLAGNAAPVAMTTASGGRLQ